MKKIYLFILILITIPSISLASSLPKFPMAFYGNVTINGKNAPEGTIIRAYCARHADTVFGQSTVDSSGNYGYIDSLSKKLLVGECSGEIIFRFETPSILKGVESTGTTTLSYPGFEEGLVLNKDLAFTYKTSSSGGGSSGGGGGGSSSKTTETTSVVKDTKPAVVIPTINNIPNFKFINLIKFGSKGNEVKELQNYLIKNGYLVGIADGFFGSMTLSAVKKFQDANKLISDGLIDLEERTILNNASISNISNASSGPTTNIKGNYNLGTTILKNGSRGEPVRELQRYLNNTLNLGLIIDGILGPKTITVVKQWQKERGLVPDGLIGPKTKALMK